MTSSAASPGQAVLRHPVVFVLVLVALTAAGGFAGSSQKPSYTAEARLVVGEFSLSGQASQGLFPANKALASTFAGLVGTTGFRDLVADQLKVDGPRLAGKLSASPISDSPILRLSASSESPTEAVAIASAASTSLSPYVQQVSRQGGGSQILLDTYRQVTVERAQAERNLAALRTRFGANPTGAQLGELDTANAVVEAASLRSDAVAAQYREQQRTAGDSAQLTVIQPADSAASDAATNRQRGLALGLVVGALTGALVAFVLERWRARRAVPPQPAAAEPPAVTSE